MCSGLVLLRHQCVECFPRLADRRIDLLAKGNAVEFVEHGLLVSFDNAVGLRALGPGSGLVDILDGEIEFAFGMLGIAAIIYAAIGQHAREPHSFSPKRGTARSFKSSAAVIGVLRSWSLANASFE
jgi:hypothetical protein